MKETEFSLPGRRKVDEVIEKATERANALLREAYADADAANTAVQNRIEEMRAEYGRKLYDDIEKMRRESENSASSSVDARIEGVRAERLSALKERFLSGVRNADEQTKRRWLSSLIEGSAADLGVGILHIRKEDESAARELTAFDVRTDLEGAGGVIAESADGTVLLDFTLEALAESYWQASMSDILGLLFG